MPVTRVVLVDDRLHVRAGVAALLAQAEDVEVAGQAADVDEAVEVCGSAAPGVVLVGLSTGLDAVAAARALLALHPPPAVVVLTSLSDQGRVGEVLDAGAVGYLLTDGDPRDLVSGVRAAVAGHLGIDPRVARSLTSSPAGAAHPAGLLSARERQVLALVSEGMANRQVAEALGITEHTVKVHLGNVFRRLGVGNRTAAAAWAREHLPEAGGDPHAR